MILQSLRLSTLPLAATLLLTPAAFATVHAHHRSSTHAMVRRTATHSTHTSHFSDRPTYGMSSERATEIQSALIQHGYLTGEPSGTWDSASIAAMQKLQGDNGWQTKLVPDSRALIKLGLGPNTTPQPTTSATAQTPPLPSTY